MSRSSLIYLIQISLITIVIAFVIDKIMYLGINKINNQVFTGEKSGGKLNQFLKQKDELDLLIFGSSRANHHIDPSKINKNGFNMGLDGTKIAYSGTLIKVLPKNKKQTILLHISPKNSFDQLYSGEDILKLSKLYHQNEIVRKEIVLLNQNSIIQDFFWCNIYNNAVLGIIKNYFLPQYDYRSYSGFDPLKVSSEQQNTFKLILDKWEAELCTQELSLNPLYKKYLTELKQFCDENNKKLILFTAPIYRDDCKNDDIKLTQLLEKQGFVYWNYSDYFKNDRSTINWKDNTHLSDVGADMFTQEIKRKLNHTN